MMEAFMEILPILLAVVATITCGARYHTERRKTNKLAMGLAVVASVLLIVAQTSWWSSYIMQGTSVGTWFADRVWAVFNSLTMISFIISSEPKFKS